jgi:two-component system, OmpR family, response regulator MprA
MKNIFIESNNDSTLKSILIISDDLTFLRKFKQNSNSTYNIKYFEKNKFYLLHNEINNSDLIIFDNTNDSLENFIDVFKLIKSYKFNIPTIILDDKKRENLSLYKFCNAYTILPKSIDEKSLFDVIEISIHFLFSNKKVQFEKGYYFDISRELLFQDKKIINLTKTETKLIKLLAENSNTLVTYEDIANSVWQRKNFSIFSLRNVVRQIRSKTDELFITNSSNKGYVLSTI